MKPAETARWSAVAFIGCTRWEGHPFARPSAQTKSTELTWTGSGRRRTADGGWECEEGRQPCSARTCSNLWSSICAKSSADCALVVGARAIHRPGPRGKPRPARAKREPYLRPGPKVIERACCSQPPAGRRAGPWSGPSVGCSRIGRHESVGRARASWECGISERCRRRDGNVGRRDRDSARMLERGEQEGRQILGNPGHETSAIDWVCLAAVQERRRCMSGWEQAHQRRLRP